MQLARSPQEASRILGVVFRWLVVRCVRKMPVKFSDGWQSRATDVARSRNSSVNPLCHPWGFQNAAAYPRPISGIFVAMTVIVCTLASSGRLAMNTTAFATLATFIVGSTAIEPSA